MATYSLSGLPSNSLTGSAGGAGVEAGAGGDSSLGQPGSTPIFGPQAQRAVPSGGGDQGTPIFPTLFGTLTAATPFPTSPGLNFPQPTRAPLPGDLFLGQAGINAPPAAGSAQQGPVAAQAQTGSSQAQQASLLAALVGPLSGSPYGYGLSPGALAGLAQLLGLGGQGTAQQIQAPGLMGTGGSSLPITAQQIQAALGQGATSALGPTGIGVQGFDRLAGGARSVANLFGAQNVNQWLGGLTGQGLGDVAGQALNIAGQIQANPQAPLSVTPQVAAALAAQGVQVQPDGRGGFIAGGPPPAPPAPAPPFMPVPGGTPGGGGTAPAVGGGAAGTGAGTTGATAPAEGGVTGGDAGATGTGGSTTGSPSTGGEGGGGTGGTTGGNTGTSTGGEGGGTGTGTGTGDGGGAAGDGGGPGGLARGGPVPGRPGQPKRILAHGKEYVVKAGPAQKHRTLLQAINAGKPASSLLAILKGHAARARTQRGR